MAKGSSGALLGRISLQKASSLPLYQQLVSQLRQSVVSRELNGGTRLPSSRQLAVELGVSRLTVQNAYEQLIAEGYLEARVGSGTYVQPAMQAIRNRKIRSAPWSHTPVNSVISSRGNQVFGTLGQLEPAKAHSFRPGIPATDAFPLKLWNRLTSRRLRSADHQMLTYGAREGYWPLRVAIADYLRDSRMVECEPAQVIVLSGSQRAFSLATWSLLEEGDPVWFENPGYPAARDVMAANGADILPVPLDGEGLSVAAGLAKNPSPMMIYTTPSGQFPTGTTMSLPRRRELLKLASRVRAWVLEDDYDGEFRYTGRPLPSLQGLDDSGCVLYLGTFSKTLLPSLRLGYMVVPRELVEVFAAAAALFDLSVPTLPQAVVADFIAEGHFQAHLRKMRNLYAERQRVLVEALREELGGLLEASAVSAGMHLVAWLPDRMDDKAASRRAQDAGVDAMPLSGFSLHPCRPGLVIGFACMPPEQIRPGVKKLAQALLA